MQEFKEKALALGTGLAPVSIRKETMSTLEIAVSVINGNLTSFNDVCDDIMKLAYENKAVDSVCPFDEDLFTVLVVRFKHV